MRQITSAIILLISSLLFNAGSVSAITTEDFRLTELEAPIFFGGEAPVCFSGGSSIDLGPLEDAALRRANLVSALSSDLDLDPVQAAGIVGNFVAESGGPNLPPNINEILGIEGDGPGPPRPVIEGTNTGGYGWAQWTGGRKTSFIEYAVENGYVPSAEVDFNDAANYAYLIYELTETGESGVVESLREETTPEDAALTFMREFERPGVEAAPKREEGARQAYQDFQNIGGEAGITVSCDGGPNSAAIVGEYAFPLMTTKSGINNPGIFSDGTTSTGTHPYVSYDIYTDPDTPVAAFMEGRVIRTGTDVCGGATVGIYNEESDIVASYLHLRSGGRPSEGDVVELGEQIGLIGSTEDGCTVPHLHIDVVTGSSRPSCSRANCPDSARERFVDIGEELYETYQQLAD